MLRGGQFGPLDAAVVTVTATTSGQRVNSELPLWVWSVSQDSKPWVQTGHICPWGFTRCTQCQTLPEQKGETDAARQNICKGSISTVWIWRHSIQSGWCCNGKGEGFVKGVREGSQREVELKCTGRSNTGKDRKMWNKTAIGECSALLEQRFSVVVLIRCFSGTISGELLRGTPQTSYTRVWGCGSGTECFRCAATVEMHSGGGGLVAQSCLTLETPQTVARQALLSVGLSRREYWTELPFPSPRDLPDPGIKPASPALQANSWTLSHQGSPWDVLSWDQKGFFSALLLTWFF